MKRPSATHGSTRLILCGLEALGQTVITAVREQPGLQLVAIHSDNADHAGRDAGGIAGGTPLDISVINNFEALLDVPADCVIFAAPADMSADSVSTRILRLLAAGKNVISSVPFGSNAQEKAALLAACREGNSAFHATGLFPQLLLERLALTLGHALEKTSHIRVIQAIDCDATAGISGGAFPTELWDSIKDSMADDTDAAGIAATPDESSNPWLHHNRVAIDNAASNTARQLFGAHHAPVHSEITITTTPASLTPTPQGEAAAHDHPAAIHRIQRTLLGEHCFLTVEQHWYHGRNHACHGDALPYGHFNTPYSFTVQVEGHPARLDSQLELAPSAPGSDPLLHTCAQGMLAAIAGVCAAPAGEVVHDASPRYQHDTRMPGVIKAATKSPRARKKYRVVIWGPGEIGGAVTRAALQRDNIEIVGARVFSPHKHGKDLGELVGIGPIGVRATRSTKEILALRPDCVIVTPQPRAIVEGLDNDVIQLLEAGINVITSAAYHNVTMPNWLASSQTASTLLQEVAQTSGMARNRLEEIAFAANARVMALSQRAILRDIVPPVMDRLLAPLVQRAMPFRATPERLQQACRKGNASLHGTGVHPTFMAERVGLQLARLYGTPRHMRFIEAADFSYMPDGMWGGLSGLGFGKPVRELDANYLIARAGDFYYGDVTGNVAHLLYGVPSHAVRVERSFRGLPALRDFDVGSTRIRKGTAAAVHMVHKGYIGNHHFFTNEECWYLGPDCEFRGDDLPFGNFRTPLSYTAEAEAPAGKVRMQLSMDGTGKAAELMSGGDTSTANVRCALGQRMRKEGVTNPITNATAMAILDAVAPVCDMPAGVIIDDITPNFSVITESLS